jgi:hypothetical protein
MNFIMKQLLKAKLKGQVPEAEQEKLFAIIEKNPQFFTEVAEEVKKKVDSGMDQMQAVQQVMLSKQDELQAIKEELK